MKPFFETVEACAPQPLQKPFRADFSEKRAEITIWYANSRCSREVCEQFEIYIGETVLEL